MSAPEERRITRSADHARRLVGIAVTVVAIVACVVAGVSVARAAPHDSHPVTVAAAGVPTEAKAILLPSCGGGAVDSPLTVTLWCASPQQQLDNLSWNGWGSRTATATGDLRDTTCFCVGAPTKQFPVVVRLTDPAGSKRYTGLSISFPAARPSWAYLPSFRFVWTAQGFVSEDSAS